MGTPAPSPGNPLLQVKVPGLGGRTGRAPTHTACSDLCVRPLVRLPEPGTVSEQ